jgi:hypothetical protein
MKKRQIIALTFLLLCSLTFAQTDSSKSLKKQTLPIDTVFKTDKIELVNKSFDTLVADYKLKQSTEIDASNIISLTFAGIALLLTIFGWVCSPWINRKTKALEKQLEYRLGMLNAVIEFRNDFVNTLRFNQTLWDKADLLVQLYGNKDEVKKMISLREKLEICSKITSLNPSSPEFVNMKDALIVFVTLCRDRIREELKLEKLDA